MANLTASATTLYFNTRDEMVKVPLDRVAYFEADGNYTHVVFLNGVKATLLTSLVNIEQLLDSQAAAADLMFIRIGKRYIVPRSLILRINILRQKLTLSDCATPAVFELTIAKDALRNLKTLYTHKD